jgi:thioredoxin-related protein/ribosomal protein S21
LKRTSLIAAFLLLAVPQAFAGPWLKSLTAAQKQAKADHALIFVDLFADWCGWCHQLEQQVFPSESFQKATDGYVLLRLNTEDGADGTKLAQRYGVTSLPTSLVITHDMVVAGMIRGFLPPEPYSKMIVDTEKGFTDFRKRAASEASIASDYKKRLELAREFRMHYAFDKAIARFKKLVDDSKTPAAIRDQAYYDMALTQYANNQLDDCEKTIREFSKKQKEGDSYERSLLLLGEVYFAKGNYLSAVNELKSFKTKFPQSPLLNQVNMMLPAAERALAGTRVQ